MLYYIQNSLTGLAILAIVSWNIYRQAGIYRPHQRLFNGLIISNALLLTFEMLLNIFTGQPGPVNRILIHSIVLIFYIINPVPGAIWMLYIQHLIQPRLRLQRRSLAIASVPVLLNLIFSVISLFTPFTFTIDGANRYSRGQFFYLLAISCYIFLILTIFIVVRNRKRIRDQAFFPAFFFAFPMIAAGIIQTVFYGVSLLWLALSLSILMIYLGIQGLRVNSDELTGLPNLNHFEQYLKFVLNRANLRRQEQGRARQPGQASRQPGQLPKQLGWIVVEIQDLQQINENEGIDMGNRVVESLANILRKTFRHQDFIARIGGTLFGIVAEVGTYADLEYAATALRDNVARFNQQNQPGFTIAVSYRLLRAPADMQAPALCKMILDQHYSEQKLSKAFVIE